MVEELVSSLIVCSFSAPSDCQRIGAAQERGEAGIREGPARNRPWWPRRAWSSDGRLPRRGWTRYQEEGTTGRLSRATAAAAASKLPASGPHYITLLLC